MRVPLIAFPLTGLIVASFQFPWKGDKYHPPDGSRSQVRPDLAAGADGVGTGGPLSLIHI